MKTRILLMDKPRVHDLESRKEEAEKYYLKIFRSFTSLKVVKVMLTTRENNKKKNKRRLSREKYTTLL